MHLINIHLFLTFVNQNNELYIRICAESSLCHTFFRGEISFLLKKGTPYEYCRQALALIIWIISITLLK